MMTLFLLSCFLYSVYTPFHEDSPDTSTKVWNALANSLILMAVIVVMTVLLIVLYKYRCYKVGLSIRKLRNFIIIFIIQVKVKFSNLHIVMD